VKDGGEGGVDGEADDDFEEMFFGFFKGGFASRG
jgi:hypothetical protein